MLYEVITTTSVTWQSSDSTVASIVAGVLTTHKVGRTVMTVISDDTTNGVISDTMVLEVIDGTPDDPSAFRGDIQCKLLDYMNNEVSGYNATLYSTPVTLITDANVITSYSIHYTKLYELMKRRMFCKSTIREAMDGAACHFVCEWSRIQVAL